MHSSSVISLEFIFLLVRCDTAFQGELSLICDSFSFRSAELNAKASGMMLLVGICVPFASLHFVELAFASLALAFAELVVLSAFAYSQLSDLLSQGSYALP